mmetsp:Transcript_14802/g.21005  ORF Transcript_14802/g.21005 Transcript_14802/m.21005 type:complete len:425 (-) Transcript_14802:53-1327(-)|eukprot:CAMPEP_0201686754 /NCGR_PEP_ID=MMETSP0578-20130828/1081_1 /ASSEMBLY_ACC=CAM_ASM_000663 /TAXON_ID=267565 /ORGANISM="Skeletonema grethea, Strain CCMP 1804" /LENGTH=424 /DNA_ID=CAMNT_0048170847 /DNA_START=55 /DNA_END=1329 /DNA_ORIENTATION=-
MIFSKPMTYEEVRPHHLLALYSTYHVLTGILSSSRLIEKLKTHLSNHATTVISKLSDFCLPLVYSPITSYLLPDALIRYAIRVRCSHTLIELGEHTIELDQERKMEIASELKSMPIAIETQSANDQHYEVPARFYDLCLGPNKKYSSGLWPFKASKLGKGKNMTWDESLEKSEVAMLDLYMKRAGIKDGMKVVDLGCGWGSVTLHVAKHYPNCKITSISNSHSQREYILNTAKERGYNVDNIRVITCDASKWEDDAYCAEKLHGVENNDRVISIEMFEHMKNYSVLFKKVNSFLGPDGKLFVHVFTHKDHAYHFSKGWMADTFFTGGTMPSDDLFLYFAEHFSIANHWRVNGSNYEKTSNAWLKLMDRNWKSGELKPVLEEAYGEGKGYEWYVNWRLFYLACAELFGMNGGEEWIVSHYLFDKR